MNGESCPAQINLRGDVWSGPGKPHIHPPQKNLDVKLKAVARIKEQALYEDVSNMRCVKPENRFICHTQYFLLWNLGLEYIHSRLLMCAWTAELLI